MAHIFTLFYLYAKFNDVQWIESNYLLHLLYRICNSELERLLNKDKEVSLKKLLILSAILLSGCSTVTIQPERTAKLVSAPHYEETLDFYFWGLKGEHSIDVVKVCGDSQVKQMQTQLAIENGLFSLLTLGIYAPHTVKIWCGEK